VNEHDQFRELLEAYALGALDSNERASIEAHLAAGCPECTSALAEARRLVSQLAYLAPTAEPSEMLRARLLQKVRAEGQSGDRPSAVPVKSSIPWWMWAGVAALLILSVYSTWKAHQLEQTVRDVQATLDKQIKENESLNESVVAARQEAHILADPNSKRFIIWPNDKQMPKLEATWHPNMGIYVTGWQVPMPSKDHVLQLWLISKTGKPMPSRTFWPDAKGKVDLMVDNPPEVLAQTKALAITEEPMGGSPQPTTTPMWVGGVS
jgi:anti-sigma-K factor RskA